MTSKELISSVQEAKNTISSYFDDSKMVATLKNHICKGATDEEFTIFSELCKSSGLNPFKKEIWFIKTYWYNKQTGKKDPKLNIFTGINGFFAVANRNPSYDGMECGIIYGDDREIIGATCKVYRKDRKYPTCSEVYVSDYAKGNKNGTTLWDTSPRIMILKVCKSVALREAFPQELNGVYTEEEFNRVVDSLGSIPIDVTKQDKVEEISNPIDNQESYEKIQPETILSLPEKIERIETLMTEKGFTDEKKEIAFVHFGVKGTSELNEEESNKFLSQLMRM